MKTNKYLGVWMDHSSAHLIEYATDTLQEKTIDSLFTHAGKEESLSKSENLMHHKEQQQQATYYKKIAEIILNFNQVPLFGPTDANVELFNLLRADHRFADINIVVKQTDKMTENQEAAFVKAYFKNAALIS